MKSLQNQLRDTKEKRARVLRQAPSIIEIGEEFEAPSTPPFIKGMMARGLVVLAVVIAAWLLIGAPNPFRGSQPGTASAVSLGIMPNGPTPRVGQAAPLLNGTLLDGQAFALENQRGKVVLVNFFATWCGPCRAEMPDIDSVAREYRDRGLVVVAVDLQEDAKTVRSYAETLGLGFPILMDPDGQLTSRYAILGLPSSFFIDRSGNLREINVGPLSKQAFIKKIAGLLEES